MELRQLKSFKTIAELLSFSKAAKALNYGQSTITEHIQSLERELGAPLFNRLGKTVTITEVGETLYAHVIDLNDVLDKIENVAKEEDSLNGEINVGISETLIIYRLQPLLERYRRDFSAVNIRLVNDNCTVLRSKVSSGELDLIITLDTENKSNDLVTTTFNKEALEFVGSTHSPIEEITQENSDAISDECFIFTEKDCSLRTFTEHYLFNKKIAPSAILEFSSIEAIKQCVVSNLGISLLPKMCVETLVEEGKLKAIPADDESLVLYTQMSYHKDKWLSPAAEKFIAYATELLQVNL